MFRWEQALPLHAWTTKVDQQSHLAITGREVIQNLGNFIRVERLVMRFNFHQDCIFD
jgi:hypothetical protein